MRMTILMMGTCSPKINRGLLSRSEVVALINTLNRFTESLVAVNGFRKMWAEQDQGSQGKLLEETVEKLATESAAKVSRFVV